MLLVVAADDGPMPQTVEHLDILEFLDVREGAVALTKIDRCDTARIEACEREIAALLANTGLTGAPLFRVSSVTGAGIDALKAHLAEAASAPRSTRRGAGFRLAVDRVFTLDGLGTVVTGTVFSGEVRVGDEMAITPSGASARVRSIHAQNRPAERGRAGERCALVLAGVPKDAVARGDWIVAPHLHAPTARFDARVSVSAREQESLRQWSAVHLHLGAEHVMARVALLDTEALAPRAQGFVQIVPERPIGALAGDAFILRDASATRTIGGGRVHRSARAVRRRRTPSRIEALRLMAEPDPQRRLSALLAHSEHGVDLNAFRIAFNLAPNEIAQDVALHRVREGATDVAFGAAQWSALRERLLGAVKAFHAEHPRDVGVDVGRLRRTALPRLDEAVVGALAASLLKDGRLARSGSAWHVPGHGTTLSERDQRLADAALPLIDAGGNDPPDVAEIAAAIRRRCGGSAPPPQGLARVGVVYQITEDRFFSRAAVGNWRASRATWNARRARCARESFATVSAWAASGRSKSWSSSIGSATCGAPAMSTACGPTANSPSWTRPVRPPQIGRRRHDGAQYAQRKRLVPGGAAGLQIR